MEKIEKQVKLHRPEKSGGEVIRFAGKMLNSGNQKAGMNRQTQGTIEWQVRLACMDEVSYSGVLCASVVGQARDRSKAHGGV